MSKLKSILIAGAATAGGYGLYALATAPLHAPHAGPARRASVAQADALADPAQRRAYFGELHLHTGYSFDAYALLGARTTPDDAYRFSKGEPVRFMGQIVQ